MTDYAIFLATYGGILLVCRYAYLEAIHITRPRVRIDPHAAPHGDVPGRPSHD